VLAASTSMDFYEITDSRQNGIYLYNIESLNYDVRVTCTDVRKYFGSYFVFQNLSYYWLGFFVLQGIFSAFVSIELRILCAVVTHRRNQYFV
jgi:hypothetical protein